MKAKINNSHVSLKHSAMQEILQNNPFCWFHGFEVKMWPFVNNNENNC